MELLLECLLLVNDTIVGFVDAVNAGAGGMLTGVSADV
jgi:hypothetical protein